MTVARGHVSSSEKIFLNIHQIELCSSQVDRSVSQMDAHSSQSIQKLNLEREVREDDRIFKWVQTTYYVMRFTQIIFIYAYSRILLTDNSKWYIGSK